MYNTGKRPCERGSYILDAAYHILASLCCRIRALPQPQQQAQYRQFWSGMQEGRRRTYARFPFLEPQARAGEAPGTPLSPGEVQQLQAYLESEAGADICLLSCLDRLLALPASLDRYLMAAGRGVYRFAALGDPAACGGLLLPRFHPQWRKRGERTGAALSEDPLSVMENYLWVDLPACGPWQVENLYSPQWAYRGAGPFRIVCSPLLNKVPFRFETGEEGGTRYFYITAYDGAMQEAVATRCMQVLDSDVGQMADLALFPEVMATRETQQTLAQRVKQGWANTYPHMILLPSTEYQGEDGWHNETLALDGVGSPIFRYRKQQAFQYKDQEGHLCFEPVQPDHCIKILHVPGVGRIGICICADVFAGGLLDLLLKTYQITLLLVLSYSPGHERFLRSLARAADGVCDVIWCNSCAAYDPGNGEAPRARPAVLYLPYGHKPKQKPAYLQIKNCTSPTPCGGCMMVIEIAPTYDGRPALRQIMLPATDGRAENV